MTNRIAFIDMLRGAAAMLVMFHHCFVHFSSTFGAIANHTVYRFCGVLSDLNVEAVLLFFVVSGFSIRLSVERLDLRSRAGVNEYIYRRLKRILPLYVFALGFAALCVVAFGVTVRPGALSPWTLLGNLAFLQTSASVRGYWVIPYADNGPLWSLSFEMFYYVLLPIHYVLVAEPKARFVTAWLISAAGLVLNVALPNPIAQFTSHYAIWYCGVELAGMYLTRSSGALVISALAWAALLVVRMKYASATLTNWSVGLTLFFAGYGVLRFAKTGTELQRSLGVVGAPFAWVGSFSYALYLLHFPLVVGLAHVLGDTPSVLALAVSLSFAVSLAAERLSTRPRYAFLKSSYV